LVFKSSMSFNLKTKVGLSVFFVSLLPFLALANSASLNQMTKIDPVEIQKLSDQSEVVVNRKINNFNLNEFVSSHLLDSEENSQSSQSIKNYNQIDHVKIKEFEQKNVNSNSSSSQNQTESDVSDYENVRLVYEPKQIVAPSDGQNLDTPDQLSSNSVLLSEMIGFSESNIENGSADVPSSFELKVSFDELIPKKIVENMSFYPSIDFDIETSDESRFVTIKPKPNLERNKEYIFGLKAGILCDEYNFVCDAVSDEQWIYAISFKTAWSDKKVIGQSHQGRDITAHYFGEQQSGKPKILLTGGVHGEEWRSGALWDLVNYLEGQKDAILSSGKEFIIVPEVNRDGADYNRYRVAITGDPQISDGRYNSRGVNLNRNFPAGWESCAICGSGPASELETQTIVKLTQDEKPTHLITYHAQWPPNGIIFMGNTRNDDTIDFANWVADRTGYPVGVYNGPEVEGGTKSVPGDQAVWSETQGVRSLLIEATYRSKTDWDKNFPMYQALLFDL